MSLVHLSDRTVYNAECELIALAVGFYALYVLVTGLRRSRPDLRIGRPVAVAFTVRLFAAVGLGQLSVAQALRGGDELTFLQRAHDIAAESLGSHDSTHALTSQLHTFLFSLHFRILGPDPPSLMLRIEMIALSVIGLTLLAAAVYELAGARAARIAAWVIALEPANVFFSSFLHKEPLMFAAEGAVAYGGATLWKRGKLSALVPMVLGCLVATATRPYVGWFLAAAAVAVVLHASLTRQQGLRALALAAAMVGLMIVFFPVVLHASSKKSLSSLQQSQDANAADSQANLSLEHVDYSTRGKLITNLPKRIRDVILRPYPWQSQNTSQRLGILGTFVMLFCVFLLAGAVARNGTAVMKRAGPLVYPAFFMLVAYSLSAGNAGTAFRYRTHVVAIALGLVVVLRAPQRARRTADAPPEHVLWRNVDAAPTLAK